MSLFRSALDTVPHADISPMLFWVVHPGFAAPDVEVVMASMITPPVVAVFPSDVPGGRVRHGRLVPEEPWDPVVEVDAAADVVWAIPSAPYEWKPEPEPSAELE
jgi:hypothetical protein